MPLLPALRAFFTRLLTDADDALFPQHVFCLTCGALSLPNAICPVCLAVLDDLRLPSDALAPNAAAVWGYHGIARQLVLMLKYSGIAECAQVLADGMASACPFVLPPDTVVTSVPMTKKHLDARGGSKRAVQVLPALGGVQPLLGCGFARADQQRLAG